MPVEVWDIRPALAPMVSFVCALLVFIGGSRAGWRRFWSMSAALLKFIIVASMLPGTVGGVAYTFRFAEFAPGIGIGFRADALGMAFATVSSLLWVVATVYSIGYMKGERSLGRFFGFFALCVSATVALALAENLLTLFIFYEVLTISAYPLVVHDETPEALRAGRTYLTYTLTGGGVILLGIAMTYVVSDGVLAFGHNGIVPPDTTPAVLAILFVMLTLGFGVKAAIMPLHGWLPRAMVAPTPVSALLHAVAVVKAGAFGVVRTVHDVFGVELLRQTWLPDALAYLAAFTIIAASVMALLQDNLKRRLAYSTVSQLSYVLLGIALLNPWAAVAAVVHIANQAVQKVTMFFAAGAIQRTTGKTNISEMSGIGRRMPATMGAFGVAALGFTGMPLLAGFISKWHMSVGGFDSGMWWVALVMAASALLNAAYWFPMLYLAFFKPVSEEPTLGEARPSLLYPTLVCAVLVILLGLVSDLPGMPLSIARTAVAQAFGM